MKSARFGNRTIEMGANWIVGGGNKKGDINPILALADEFNINYIDDKYDIAGYEKDSSIRISESAVKKMWNKLNKSIHCLSLASDEQWERDVIKRKDQAPTMSARSALSSKCDWSSPFQGKLQRGHGNVKSGNWLLIATQAVECA